MASQSCVNTAMAKYYQQLAAWRGGGNQLSESIEINQRS